MDNIKLKPCAHCGGHDIRLARHVDADGVGWYVECIDCGIQTQLYTDDCELDDIQTHVVYGTETAIESAVDAWNTRADSSVKPTIKYSEIIKAINGMSRKDFIKFIEKCGADKDE